MSVATELVQTCPAPLPEPAPRARLAAVPAPDQPGRLRGAPRPGGAGPARRPLPAGSGGLAEVHVLRPPVDLAGATWHLTRRGLAVLATAVAVAALALMWLAVRSAPPAPQPGTPGPGIVTVHAGDTLWAIASRVAPDVDPRAEVATLQRLNGLHGAALVPGQQLRLR